MALYLAAGEVIVSWAIADQAFDHWTLAIYTKAEGHKKDPKFPLMFGRKKDFLRRCFNQIAVLAPHKETAHKILDRAVAVSDMRDQLIHGALTEQVAGGTDPVLEFRRTTVKNNEQSEEIRRYRLSEIVALGGLITPLASDALDMAAELLDAPWAKMT